MNCIAFSLYGNNPRYLVGVVENALMAKKFYSGWKVHVWIDTATVPDGVAADLNDQGAVIHEQPRSMQNGMFSRFLIHDLPGVERYIIRDVDSRFSEREVKAVNEWIASGRQLHIMRDHPYHSQAMMGGMWGWRRDSRDTGISMARSIQPWCQVVRYGRDQDFLSEVVWADDACVHDSCGTFDNTRNWPSDGPGFVGEYIDQHGHPNQQHRQMRLDYLRKHALQPA